VTKTIRKTKESEINKSPSTQTAAPYVHVETAEELKNTASIAPFQVEM